MSRVLLDVPITVAAAPSGVPISFISRSGRHEVHRALSTWQAPGDARLFRLQITSPRGPAVAEVAAYPGGEWKLRRLFE